MAGIVHGIADLARRVRRGSRKSHLLAGGVPRGFSLPDYNGDEFLALIRQRAELIEAMIDGGYLDATSTGLATWAFGDLLTALDQDLSIWRADCIQLLDKMEGSARLEADTRRIALENAQEQAR